MPYLSASNAIYRIVSWIVCGLTLVGTSACDGGLAPPALPATGTVHGTVTYVTPPDAWPRPDSLRDLRFFALPFVPEDTLDLFRDLNQLVFSDRLSLYVTADTFIVEGVPARTYIYSGVAQQFDTDLLDWRPVGLVDQVLFFVRPDETTQVSIEVDFTDLPPFPPRGG